MCICGTARKLLDHRGAAIYFRCLFPNFIILISTFTLTIIIFIIFYHKYCYSAAVILHTTLTLGRSQTFLHFKPQCRGTLKRMRFAR